MNDLSKMNNEASLPDGSVASLSWQTIASTIMKTMEGLDQLNVNEKTKLEEMIRDESSELKELVQRSSNNEELIKNLVDLVRTKLSFSAPSSPSEKDQKEANEKLDAAFKKLIGGSQGAAAKATLKASVKHIQKVLKKSKEAPKIQKNRRVLLDAFDNKKYIVGVTGAQDLLEAAGYKPLEERKKVYLEIDQEAIKFAPFEKALAWLNQKAGEFEEGEKEPAKQVGPRVQCLAGCGFFGDEKSEGLCSKCYAKKYNIEGSKVEEKEVQTFCTKGCGFWGSKKFKGMCSSCHSKDSAEHRKELKRKWRVAITKIRAVHRFKLSLKPVQTEKNRCWKCRRKIGITGIECRCGYIFCGHHRYADEHDCEYDYKKAQRRKLMEQNMKLTGKKFDKIDSEE